MVMPRVSQVFGRLLANRQVHQESKRTLYPFFMRYMAARVPGGKVISPVEEALVYVGFLVGILGPPTYIMYDVGKKRPDNKKN